MECNKYEAIRAKEVAVAKMQKNDFVGARKLALKAQQIYPGTDNITQLITVCDVHCASQKKIDAYEMDWYGILQIAQTADDSLIKKHYRKLALLLHPDKNIFPGAEAAFKLIGEAQRLLSDPVKRRMHDMKRKTYVKPPVPYQQPNNHYTAKQSFQSGFKGPPMTQYANVNLRQQNQPPAQPAVNVSTFATRCPHCINMRHAPVSDKNRHVFCFTCKKTFIAIEVKSDDLSKEMKDKKAAFVKKEVPNQGQSANGGKFKENVHSKEVYSNVSTEAASSKGAIKNRNDMNSKKVNKRKRKKSEEDSETDSESDTDEDEIFVVDDKMGNIHGIGTDGLLNPRRSTRQKQKISYDESRIDDDELLSHDMAPNVKCTSERENEGAKLKGSECEYHNYFEPASNNSTNHCNRAQELNREFPAEEDHKTSSYSYPEPDFNNFDDIRKEECFKVGQIWALYDDVDAMPRFYGRVKTLYMSNKKLLLTWLEKVSDDDMTQTSADGSLPCSSGKYSSDRTQILDMDDGSFSHPVIWEKGSGKNTYCIYPRRGQVWALFKNWNPNQGSESMSTKTYEYEYVEVVSHYVEGRGVTVAYLGKAKGYKSIFCRMDSDGKTYCIPQHEIVRFSHMIPSFQLNGEERGIFELDPASIPVNEKAVVDLGDLKILSENFKPSFENDDDVASPRHSMDGRSENESEDNDSSASKGEQNEPPDSEFFAFESNRSEDKFKVGQIWAIYCNDGLPKYYLRIERIKSSPEFQLVTKWLTLCEKQKQGDIIQWRDEEMPAGCGIFELIRGKPKEFSPANFSHVLNPQPTSKKGEYAIFPTKGEVWALYEDWKPEINFEDIGNFEYEIAEVLCIDDFGVDVLLLQQVSGHVTVFRGRGQSNRDVIRIPKAQLLRFSHQIPAFLLTDELNGTLRGCWELDPAAIPPALLISS